MERAERRAVADRDDRCGGQPLLQQAVQHRLGRLVERRGRLVEEQIIRRVKQHARDGEPLLLAAGKHAVPVRLLVQPGNQFRQADRGERFGELRVVEACRPWPDR